MTSGQQAGDPRPGSLARSGLAMATGTLASRGTGFLRTVVIAAAMGLRVGDSYNVANTIPNIVYDLLLGGVLTSVVVPLLVQAARDDGDSGEAAGQRLVTIVVAVLTVVAVLGVVLAPQIVSIYGNHLHPPQRELATTFARYFLPQVLFYGVGAVLGAILNTRGSFVAPMWAPVLNNLAVIVSGGLFIAITSGTPQPGHLGRAATLVLALGTTGGVVLQTIALLPVLRRVGFRLRARWDWRGAGLRSAGVFAAWITGYVVTNQVGYAVIVNLATAAGRAQGPHGSGLSPYTYAFILFSLPYAVVSVTVITALFPQMSRSGVDRDHSGLAETSAEGLNLSGVILVPATVALVCLGPLLGTIVFAHGNIGLDGARLIGATLAGFGIGLVPFSAFQLQLRAFLAMRDSRTPFLVNLPVTAVNIAADVALYLLLPARDKVVGLALGFSLSYAVGVAIFGVLLRRRLGPAERPVLQTHVRLGVAALLAAGPTYLAARLLVAGLGRGPEAAFVAVVVACLAGAGTFLAVARRMRITELTALTALVRRRLRLA
ncbi:MAG: murein biosynthesis integral membrane protein MurJ [Frankiales bacterium]|nr:murein biosynthesis integral membrane protein MurJ [Frankiales bacterium]